MPDCRNGCRSSHGAELGSCAVSGGPDRDRLGSGGELIMADYSNLTPARAGPAVEPCWMCGIRLPVTQMVADGGSACDSVRWYCHDVKGCTKRWTGKFRYSSVTS